MHKQLYEVPPAFAARARFRKDDYEQAYAESIPLPDDHVDFVSMGYALRHVGDLDRAFSEYLGPDTTRWADYDAEALLKRSKSRTPILIDQGDALWGEYGVVMAPAIGIVGKDGKLASYDTFRATWNDPQFGSSLVTFRLGADGKPAGLTIANQQMPMVFRRR